MLSLITVLALQVASGGAGQDGPKISDVDFRAYFDAARAGKLTIPDEAIEEARRYRYVFVAGFHNERLPGYFAENRGSFVRRECPRRRSILYSQARTTPWQAMRGLCASSLRRLRRGP